MDAAAPYEGRTLTDARLGPFDTWLLVSDPEPGPRVAAPAPREADLFLTIAVSDRSYVLLANTDTFAGSEHTGDGAVAEVLARIAAAGNPEVVVVAEDGVAWARTAAALDALAGAGIVPTMGLAVTGETNRPVWPAIAGATRVEEGAVVPVLPFSWATKRLRSSMLIQVLGGD
ncbi:MAG: hypothetical protein ACOZNI_33930 [Myxococcota bacterium]